MGSYFIDTFQVAFGEFYLQCASVFLKVFPPLRAGYGNDILALSKQPCQGKLSGRRAFLFSNRLQACHQVQILPEVFPLKARRIPPVIVWSKILEPFYLPGQESASPRPTR